MLDLERHICIDEIVANKIGFWAHYNSYVKRDLILMKYEIFFHLSLNLGKSLDILIGEILAIWIISKKLYYTNLYEERALILLNHGIFLKVLSLHSGELHVLIAKSQIIQVLISSVAFMPDF